LEKGFAVLLCFARIFIIVVSAKAGGQDKADRIASLYQGFVAHRQSKGPPDTLKEVLGFYKPFIADIDKDYSYNLMKACCSHAALA